MSLTKQDLNDVRDIILDALDAVVNPRFDRLESRMDIMENLMSEQGGRIDLLESAFRENNRRLSSLEYGLIKVENRLEVVEGKVTALHNDVMELYGMVS